ncbi:MAG TPA: phage portal protein [Candidatus Cloacimonetes bacterium]|nr:phage portal protein [Candidatus Cloacimonadota bacterium]
MRFRIFKSAKPKKERSKRIKSDEYARPFDVDELISAYYSNSWHAGCINLKTICILGDGIEDKAIEDILKESVREDSVFTLLQKTILDLRIFGDAFWEVVRVGGAVEIYHIPSWTMTVNKYGKFVQEVDDKRVEFPDDELWHFREPSLLSQIWGTPDYMPLIKDEAISTISTIKKYNNNFFRNNAIPDGILFIQGGDISASTEMGLRQFFLSKFRGVENAAKFCIAPVPEGVKIQLEKLQDHSDGKFLELQDSLIAEIVSCHGVPPRLASLMMPGSLGGGGEASGELKIFLNTRIKPLQNVFGGQLDKFFMHVFDMDTDISFIPFDIMPESAEIALSALRGGV